MASYIFIVNKKTFPIHLKYMFAGTGKGDGTENIGMIEDISGCRKGDDVIFYLTQNGKEEGKFFGSFKIKSDYAFWENKGDSHELSGKKILTNRILIEPNNVYSKGITEWNCLDNLDNLPDGREGKAKDLIWSLIYRKLSAGRGCTPIFDYEFDRIMELIEKIPNNRKLSNNCNLDFVDSKIIESINQNLIKYNVSTISKFKIPLLDQYNNTYSPEEKIVKLKNGEVSFIYKTKNGKARKQHKCEAELECFFNQNACLNNNKVDEIIGKKENIKFFGSQIICGMGERRIDILSIDNNEIIKLIELKDELGYYNKDFIGPHLKQIQNYIKWCIQYIKYPEKKIIQSILVINKREKSKKQITQNMKLLKDITNTDLDKIKNFNRSGNDCKLLPIRIFFWFIKNNKLEFEEYKYL